MRLRTFTAPDMPTAMKMVRDALGDDAIILASDSAVGRRNVSVTAAVEHDDEPIAFAPPKRLSDIRANAEVENLRHEIHNVLRFHNIPDLFISKMLRYASHEELESLLALQRVSARGDDKNLLISALEKITEDYFRFEPLAFDLTPVRLMLIGTPGIGKTLTIARIATQISMIFKSKIPNLTVITTDEKRAGGVEQLQAFTNILGLTLHTAKNADEIGDYIQSLPSSMHILVDTAGCNPYDQIELQELKALSQVKGIEPILVLPAGGDSLEAVDIVENFMSMPIKRLLITRADTARRFGGILAAAAAHGLAFCNLSGSSSIIDALQPMNGTRMAQLLLRYQLHSR